MSPRTLATLAALVLASACVTAPPLKGGPRLAPLQAVPKSSFAEPLAEGEMALEKVTDPALWPDFRVAIEEPELLLESIDQSLAYLAKPSAAKHYPYLDVTQDRVIRSLRAFREIVVRKPAPEALAQELRSRFELYRSKGRSRTGEVLFTGYCEPIYEASRTPSARFRYPLYQRPHDLRATEDGVPLGREQADGTLTPYYTRQEIDQGGALRGKGLELVYLEDPFEAFLVHVQGSARLKLADEGGRLLPVGYAGKTDRPYKSVGQAMIRDGKIPKEEMSLQALKRHFKAHPEEMVPYLFENESYVFFRTAEGGPFGSLGARVTQRASIATDKTVFPRAALAFVDCKTPVATRDAAGAEAFPQAPFRRFVLDQDTGGAIRSAGRCDIFHGTGPTAERIAGSTESVGGLYYLFLKP